MDSRRAEVCYASVSPGLYEVFLHRGLVPRSEPDRKCELTGRVLDPSKPRSCSDVVLSIVVTKVGQCGQSQAPLYNYGGVKVMPHERPSLPDANKGTLLRCVSGQGRPGIKMTAFQRVEGCQMVSTKVTLRRTCNVVLFRAPTL